MKKGKTTTKKNNTSVAKMKTVKKRGAKQVQDETKVSAEQPKMEYVLPKAAFKDKKHIASDKDCVKVLRHNEFRVMLSDCLNTSEMDGYIFKKFKYTLSKNSKVLHAVCIEPCLCSSQFIEVEEDLTFDSKSAPVTIPSLINFFSLKSRYSDWFKRWALAGISVYHTTYNRVMHVIHNASQNDSVRVVKSDFEEKNDGLSDPDRFYHGIAFDLEFQSNSAARRFLNFLKVAYEVREYGDLKK